MLPWNCNTIFSSNLTNDIYIIVFTESNSRVFVIYLRTQIVEQVKFVSDIVHKIEFYSITINEENMSTLKCFFLLQKLSYKKNFSYADANIP